MAPVVEQPSRRWLREIWASLVYSDTSEAIDRPQSEIDSDADGAPSADVVMPDVDCGGGGTFG